METLLFALGFIIAALGTWFLLYFLRTRKTLRQQDKIIVDLTFALVGKDIIKKREEMEKKDKEMAEAVKSRESAKEDDGCTKCDAFKLEENDKACDKAE